MSEQDTRERLEADILAHYKTPEEKLKTVREWLDRQASITANEMNHNNPYVGLVRGKQWERTEISDYYCGRCGWKVTDHDSYCPECGGAFHKATNKPNSQFDVLKTAENAENVTSKNEMRNFDDSREQLEADVHSVIFRWGWDSEWSRNEQRSNERVAMLWLDRQEAITRRECVEKRDGQNEHETVRQDELSDTRERLERCLRVFLGLCIDEEPDPTTSGIYYNILGLLDRQAAITERRMAKDYEEQAEQLVNDMNAARAERDELQVAIDAMGNGQFYAMYRKACEERDHFKDLAITKQTK